MADLDSNKGAHSSEMINAEPPSKRQRLSQDQITESHLKMAEILHGDVQINSTIVDVKKIVHVEERAVDDVKFDPDSREAEVGILHFVNDNGLGFSGTLKQRYVTII
jgi:hypothetical protein